MTERAMGCFFKHIHIQYSPMRDLFISLNTQTFSTFFCFLTSAFLARLSQYAPNPSVSELSVCAKYQVLIVMKHREAGLLGDDGKRQHPLTSALSPLWRQLRKTDTWKKSSLSNWRSYSAFQAGGKIYQVAVSPMSGKVWIVIALVSHVFKGHLCYDRHEERMH